MRMNAGGGKLEWIDVNGNKDKPSAKLMEACQTRGVDLCAH